MEAFLEKGGALLVCDACLAHNNINPDAIDARCKKITADDVVFLLMNAKGSLQVT